MRALKSKEFKWSYPHQALTPATKLLLGTNSNPSHVCIGIKLKLLMGNLTVDDLRGSFWSPDWNTSGKRRKKKVKKSAILSHSMEVITLVFLA